MKNLARLSGRIDTLGRKLHVGAARAVERAAREVRDDARSFAPVETGRLRGSIRAEAEGETARVTTACPYAAAVEFGTSDAAAQPFLQPAAAGRKADFVREMKSIAL